MEESVSYINKDGNKIWYLSSKGKGYFHRLDGPAVEWADGSKHWYVDGKRHRLDGPAVEYNNELKSWYVDGERHRLDGPAIEYADGSKTWFIDGIELPTKEVEDWLLENNIDLKIDEDRIAFKLRWL